MQFDSFCIYLDGPLLYEHLQFQKFSGCLDSHEEVWINITSHVDVWEDYCLEFEETASIGPASDNEWVYNEDRMDWDLATDTRAMTCHSPQMVLYTSVAIQPCMLSCGGCCVAEPHHRLNGILY